MGRPSILKSDVTDAEIAEHAAKAAAYMRDHGYRSGGLVNLTTGEVCAIGALCGAAGSLYYDGGMWIYDPHHTDMDWAVVDATTDALARHLGLITEANYSGSHAVPAWSDRADLDTVAGALEDLAVKYRPDEAPGGAL